MPRPLTLTPRSKQVFDYIVDYKAKHDGNSPTMRLLADEFHTSTSAIDYALESLERLGLVQKIGVKSNARMIKVVGAKWIAPQAEQV